MNKTKRKILSVTLVVILLFILGGIVLAKYIVTKNANKEFDVAKWDVSIGEIVFSNTEYTAETLAEDKIAPGTNGSFNVVVDATGTQTGVDYNAVFTNVSNVPANMYFKVDNTICKNLNEVGQAISGHISPDDEEKTIVKEVEWIWDYQTTTSKDGERTTLEENDIQDTLDGEAANDITFNLVVTAVQSTPVESNT